MPRLSFAPLPALSAVTWAAKASFVRRDRGRALRFADRADLARVADGIELGQVVALGRKQRIEPRPEVVQALTVRRDVRRPASRVRARLRHAKALIDRLLRCRCGRVPRGRLRRAVHDLLLDSEPPLSVSTAVASDSLAPRRQRPRHRRSDQTCECALEQRLSAIEPEAAIERVAEPVTAFSNLLAAEYPSTKDELSLETPGTSLPCAASIRASACRRRRPTRSRAGRPRPCRPSPSHSRMNSHRPQRETSSVEIPGMLAPAISVN